MLGQKLPADEEIQEAAQPWGLLYSREKRWKCAAVKIVQAREVWELGESFDFKTKESKSKSKEAECWESTLRNAGSTIGGGHGLHVSVRTAGAQHQQKGQLPVTDTERVRRADEQVSVYLQDEEACAEVKANWGDERWRPSHIGKYRAQSDCAGSWLLSQFVTAQVDPTGRQRWVFGEGWQICHTATSALEETGWQKDDQTLCRWVPIQLRGACWLSNTKCCICYANWQCRIQERIDSPGSQRHTEGPILEFKTRNQYVTTFVRCSYWDTSSHKPNHISG